ncbi:hypothetical protein SDC9_136592 [bioreactor metagenome]|uniref:Uncharacterized protein n=1 Tax=bioreactor metagenome TaxID=1076179 RepID=A0A645DKZ5_9ZZZZ
MGGHKWIGDGLRTDEIIPPLSPTDYRTIFSLLSYKTEFAGLEKPVAVSSHSIFYRCPVCGSVRRVNRWGPDKFLCVKCGLCKELELVGALNLAGTLKRYKDNRITVSCHVKGKTIHFHCRLLDLNHSCVNNEEALADFLQRVQNYMASAPLKADKKRESILRRLNDAEDLKDCFDFEMII